MTNPFAAGRPERTVGSLALFGATILAGSFLLFLVQPMVARLALPRLGGAPAVWNSAMLVYQALLLGGYGYAHALGRLAPRRQALVHLGVFALAALWLPIGLTAPAPPGGLSPALWVPWLLAISIGPLFFAVAAQAPLMQHWFAAQRPGANPYPLYAASNLGSFAGLLAYPLLFEPLVTVTHQRWLWSAGYGLLAIMVLGCALTLPRGATAAAPVTHTAATPARTWWRWIALSAVPSGLMLSTTTHLTTDVVAMPLIWVVPLGLYLLSFSVAFGMRGHVPTAIARSAPVLLVAGAVVAVAGGALGALASSAVDLALLVAVSVALHRTLYRLRPAPDRLTGFYLATSIGGVLGGLFCALVAPLVFDWVYEQPLLILAAALLLPARPPLRNRIWPRGAHGARLLVVAMLCGSSVAGGSLLGQLPHAATVAMAALLALATLAAAGRPPVFAAGLAAVMLASGGWTILDQSAGGRLRVRSYFGVYTIGTDPVGERVLIHGTTTHGIQRTEPGHQRDETSYYAPASGIGEAMTAAPALFGPGARIGVVGLGAGTLACYARPGQRWRFFEIDPAVVRIARDPSRFSFLARCLPGVPVTVGDARLSLAAAAPASLDLLVVDAFSSDAVPMHLLTREAFAVYDHVLAANGLLLVHISDRFLDLEPVLAAAAAAQGHAAAVRDYRPDAAARRAGAAHSVWVAIAADRATLARLTARGGWRTPHARAGFAAWTDDFASMLPVLRRWPR